MGFSSASASSARARTWGSNSGDRRAPFILNVKILNEERSTAIGFPFISATAIERRQNDSPVALRVMFVFDALENFLAMHGDGFGRLDAQAHLIVALHPPSTVTTTSDPIMIRSPTRRVTINMKSSSLD